MYDPTAGRFITRDPAQDGSNWYAYCDNNPLIAVDFDGLKKAVIVLLPVESGYQTGLQNVLLGQMLEYLHKEGYRDNDISYVQADTDAIISAAKDADFLGFIGHGNPLAENDEKGYPSLGEDGGLFNETSIRQLMYALHGRKLDMICPMCCYSNNQWQKFMAVSDTVWTYGPLNGITRFFANKKKRGGRQHPADISPIIWRSPRSLRHPRAKRNGVS